MPFKHNAARRHRIPKTRYRVQNWPAYEAGLKRRGDLTLWLDEAALARWQAPRRTTPGGQARYSDAAIELVLMLRLVFHLALRQAEGFAASIFRLLGQDLRVPDHTTLSRRSRGFAGRRPKVIPHGPMHLVLDSTGLKLFGQGEWYEEKHGGARRSWRKLHLAVDADTWRDRRRHAARQCRRRRWSSPGAAWSSRCRKFLQRRSLRGHGEPLRLRYAVTGKDLLFWLNKGPAILIGVVAPEGESVGQVS